VAFRLRSARSLAGDAEDQMGGSRAARSTEAGPAAGADPPRRRRALWVVLAFVGLVVIVVGVAVARFVNRNEPEVHANILDHFKYGSIGSEATAGVPYDIFLVLPRVFPDLLPKGQGRGYERMGFLYEPGHIRPIGTSYREDPIGRVGLNCAVCHSSTLQTSPDGPKRVVLGMPANQFRLQSYIHFLRDTANDPRFTPDVMIPAMEKADPHFSTFDKLLYRHFLIPRTREALKRIGDDFAWMDSRPPNGPGRVDTFNPYKFRVFGLGSPSDTTVGTADFPSIWDQAPREGMHLHWDGNNTSVAERNISAAIGAGVDPGRNGGRSSLDEESMGRILQWIEDLPAPKYPGRVDTALAARGEEVYRQSCAACHAFNGSRVGQVTPIGEIGTDRQRLDSFTPQLAKAMNTLGEGRPWHFHHFRKTNGYANTPLDGVWLRAPYLHNGSVPDLASLLEPPAQRPKVFYRGYDVYDFDRVGFVTQGPEAQRNGFRYDTSVRGNGNGGHTYGTDLPAREKRALIEYLKTL
jgi:mono/diheme cytochrome c family protein